jgi:hypothetical protein
MPQCRLRSNAQYFLLSRCGEGKGEPSTRATQVSILINDTLLKPWWISSLGSDRDLIKQYFKA